MCLLFFSFLSLLGWVGSGERGVLGGEGSHAWGQRAECTAEYISGGDTKTEHGKETFTANWTTSRPPHMKPCVACEYARHGLFFFFVWFFQFFFLIYNWLLRNTVQGHLAPPVREVLGRDWMLGIGRLGCDPRAAPQLPAGLQARCRSDCMAGRACCQHLAVFSSMPALQPYTLGGKKGRKKTLLLLVFLSAVVCNIASKKEFGVVLNYPSPPGGDWLMFSNEQTHQQLSHINEVNRIQMFLKLFFRTAAILFLREKNTDFCSPSVWPHLTGSAIGCQRGWRSVLT